MRQTVAWFYQFPGRHRAARVGFLALSVCVIAVSIFFFAISFARPQMGILLSRQGSSWIVTGVDPNGAAFKDGIRVGDTLVEINGQPAKVFLDEYGKTGAIFGNTISQIAVASSSGTLRTASVEDASASAASVAEQTAFIVISVIFWVTGFYVFLKRPKLLPAFLLALCSLVSGLALSANMAGVRGYGAAGPIAISAMTIGPWLLAHFFLILPQERSSLRKDPKVYLIYVPAAVTLALLPVLGYRNGQDLPGFRDFRMIEYGVAFAVAGGIVVVNYARAVTRQTRQQMRVVLIACLIAVVPILVLNLPAQSIWGQPPIAPGFSFLFFTFIPLGLGYAVVSRKLMDIDVVIRRGIIYGLISMLMAIILTVGILLVEAFRASISTPQRVLIALGLGVIAATLFGPAKKGVEYAVDKLFYKDRYDYRQTIQALNTSLKSFNEISDVSRLTVGATTQALNLSGACLFVVGQSGQPELGASQGTFAPDRKRTQLRERMVASQRSVRTEFPNSASNGDPELAFIVPLVFGNKEVGVLCLSQKVSRQSFSNDDLFLIQGVAAVAAIALTSAILARDVSVRDTFVSVASHELRTPLTSVLGYAELLHEDDSSEIHQRWAREIMVAGGRMSRMVDDLLNVTRIQTGKLVMKLEKLKIEVVLQDRVAFARASSSEHEFTLNIESGLADGLADREKFGQVIWNLLSNAIKYSPQGGHINVSAHNDCERNRVVISVSDQGIGIEPCDSESLFRTFHRIQRPETEGIKGTGLGLYIVKEWTEAMGGQVWLESQLNVGSTFFVAIPMAPKAKGKSEAPFVP